MLGILRMSIHSNFSGQNRILGILRIIAARRTATPTAEPPAMYTDRSLATPNSPLIRNAIPTVTTININPMVAFTIVF
jgi:uncharacterized protein YggT (Ycf19 family)